MTTSHLPGVPIPDDLLLPLLETTAEVLRSMESVDVPNSLKPIHGFDRRGLLAGPGRRQLLRALQNEEQFRDTVLERFCTRPEVQATASQWNTLEPEECVKAAADRHDLPLLASTLLAFGPEGAEFGLGLIVAYAREEKRARGEADADRDRDRTIAELEEARRRSDAARMEAEAEVVRLNNELQKERAARRQREDSAASTAEAAQRDLKKLADQLQEALAAVDLERLRSTREAKRAKALEEDVRRLRAELEQVNRRATEPIAPLDTKDGRAIADAAAAAERVAASLRSLENRLRRQAKGAASAPRRGPEPEPESEPQPAPRPAAPSARTRPELPPGVLADSPEGIEAMLRTDGVLLVVDGYNVTKRAWGDATAADQRERLGIAVTALNRRLGCHVLIVFDGDGSGIVRPELRRGGVRVVFSDAAEEADDVVVREVAGLPKRVPVVVASSDAWVRQHAEEAGAVVVSADALLRLLRPSG